MLKKAVCPECGSSNIKVQAYVRVELDLLDAQQEVTKDIINKESTRVIDDNDSPITLVYCGECYHEISREVNLGCQFKAKDLTDELCKRVEELEQFRTDTFAKEHWAELEAHDFSDQYHSIERYRAGANEEKSNREEESTDELLDRLFGPDSPENESLSEDTEEEESDSLGIVWDESEE